MEKENKKEETFEDFQKKAEELTGESFRDEDVLAQKAKDRNLADANELFSYAETKKRLELPTIGAYVEYMPLRAGDNIQIASIVDTNQEVQRDKRNRMKVYLMLHRADERYTKEAIDNLAGSIVDAILLEYEMAEDSRFLLPILNRRRDGLRQTLKRKDSS